MKNRSLSSSPQCCRGGSKSYISILSWTALLIFREQSWHLSISSLNTTKIDSPAFLTLPGIWSSDSWMLWGPQRVMCRVGRFAWFWFVWTSWKTGFATDNCTWHPLNWANAFLRRIPAQQGDEGTLRNHSQVSAHERRGLHPSAMLSVGEPQQNVLPGKPLGTCRTCRTCSALSQPPNSTLH